MRRMNFLHVVLCALLIAIAIQLRASPVDGQISRDPWKQPFAANSIWNTSIGAGASYQPSGINITNPSQHFADFEVESFHFTRSYEPSRDVYAPGNNYWQGSMQIADNLLITRGGNACSNFLMPDGKTVIQIDITSRPTVSSNVYGYMWPDQSLYGEGRLGAHGGSGLSTIGGSIRKGEFAGSDVYSIRHAIKLNIWSEKYLYYNGASNLGYRWPADRADGYAATWYHGTNPKLVMGSLLAILPSETEASVGVTTLVGKKLFHALQDYGAYVVDDTAADATALSVDQDAWDEFNAMGLTTWTTSGTFHDDLVQLANRLYIVDNNSPSTIGGGGNRRKSGPPPINLVTNPSFEMDSASIQSPSTWSEWSSLGGNSVSYVESNGGSKSGSYHGTHYMGSPYNAYTYKTLTGLSNGKYTLKAWVMSSGGQNTVRLEAKDYGGSLLSTNVPATGTWTQLKISNINVTLGQCKIGFWSDAPGGKWLFFDDVEFYQQ